MDEQNTDRLSDGDLNAISDGMTYPYNDRPAEDLVEQYRGYVYRLLAECHALRDERDYWHNKALQHGEFMPQPTAAIPRGQRVSQAG